jgi:hypothetical protein
MATNGASATGIGITLHAWASNERKEDQLMLGWISCGEYYHVLVSGMKECTPVKPDQREYLQKFRIGISSRTSHATTVWELPASYST